MNYRGLKLPPHAYLACARMEEAAVKAERREAIKVAFDLGLLVGTITGFVWGWNRGRRR